MYVTISAKTCARIWKTQNLKTTYLCNYTGYKNIPQDFWGQQSVKEASNQKHYASAYLPDLGEFKNLYSFQW